MWWEVIIRSIRSPTFRRVVAAVLFAIANELTSRRRRR